MATKSESLAIYIEASPMMRNAVFAEGHGIAISSSDTCNRIARALDAIRDQVHKAMTGFVGSLHKSLGLGTRIPEVGWLPLVAPGIAACPLIYLSAATAAANKLRRLAGNTVGAMTPHIAQNVAKRSKRGATKQTTRERPEQLEYG